MSNNTYKRALSLTWVTLAASLVPAARAADLEILLKTVDSKVIAWRRDIHQHPELSNREVRTAKLVAEQLRKLGLEVETGIARTGVVALLRSGQPGPTIALRADLDALPVVERTEVPFRSTARSNYNGEEVGVMHACGHDAHVAVLLGVAEVLTQMRPRLHGNVLFVFQPAEEGAPQGEQGGASVMLKEGLFEKYRPQVILGWHAWASFNTGFIGYRSGPLMAGSQIWGAVITGRQTHGARPWQGVDPVVTAAQVISGLQTVVSRQVDLTREPAVVTVGMIRGGVRQNIIPDSVEMRGTIRSFDEEMRDDIHERVTTLSEGIAKGARASCRVCITKNYPVTVNDPALTEAMAPTLARVAGEDKAQIVPKVMGSEDFSFFQRVVPGLFFFLGVVPEGQDPKDVAPNHSPRFFIDEKSLVVGVRALANVACDFLEAKRAAR